MVANVQDISFFFHTCCGMTLTSVMIDFMAPLLRSHYFHLAAEADCCSLIRELVVRPPTLPSLQLSSQSLQMSLGNKLSLEYSRRHGHKQKSSVFLKTSMELIEGVARKKTRALTRSARRSLGATCGDTGARWCCRDAEKSPSG